MTAATGECSGSAGLAPAELDAVTEQMRAVGVVPDGPLRSRLIAGGRSNLTYRLDDGVSAWVLRMPPRAGRTPSAHDVAREFRIASALKVSGVPVAPAVLLCEDESVIGSPFAVAGFVEGRTVQSREDLANLDPATLEVVVARLVESLASLHAVDHVVVGLERLGRPDAYAERQIKRWSGQWQIVGDPALAGLSEDLGGRLRALTFDQHSVGIVHGDFRIDNTILSFEDEVTIAAIVDWELSTIGDPVADVAMMCVYRHPALDLVLGSPSAWTSDRLPSPAALAEAYVSAGGVELVGWEQHLALAYYKLAVIAAGIDHRFRAGATHGNGFDTAGEAVAPLLEAGVAVLTSRA